MWKHFTTTRFAPSPTGYLHLGHVASALYVWGFARAIGARVLLRIEDHDRGRCRPEYEQAIFADLAWLGFHHDNAELRFGEPSIYRQSDSSAFFEAMLAKLGEQAHVYACDCSRRRIAETMQEGMDELRYDGRCRHRGLQLTAKDIGLRVEMPDTAFAFTDLLLGAQVQTPAEQCGDLLLRDRHGFYTYQWAVTADDLRHGVDLVIRGQDLTHATGRQIWLGRQLGRGRDAAFLHHPLLTDAAGKKLGKRFWSEAVASRRAQGERPETLLGEAAWRLGLIPKEKPLAAADAPALFANLAAETAALTPGD